MTSYRKYVLFVFVIGLTLISLTAGFNFYRSLFGMTTAVLCCAVFETLRLGCLWSLIAQEWLARLVAIPIYVIVAFACSFAAVTNFHAEIIENHNKQMIPIEQEIARRIDLIKRAYATKVEDDLSQLKDKIDVCNRKLAWSPDSKYWQNRLDQLNKERDHIIAVRDSFLLVAPTDHRELWISSQAAKLGLEFEPLPTTLQNPKAVTMAIQELWGVAELEAKKIVSVIIIVTTECGIILLSLLAKGTKERSVAPRKKVERKASGHHQALPSFQEKFDEDEIRKFIEKSKDTLKQHGRLPYARELSRKQRAIRKFIVESKNGESEVNELFGELGNS